MENNKPINENDLDVLLNKFVLTNDNSIIQDDLAQVILSVDYNAPINKAKEKAMLDKLTNKYKGGASLKLYLYAFLCLLIFVIIAIYFSYAKNHEKGTALNNNLNTSLFKSELISDTNHLVNDDLRKIVRHVYNDTFGKIESTAEMISKDSTKLNLADKAQNVNLKPTLPVLTDADKIRYSKVKLMILEKLSKLDKSLYSHVDANKITYGGKLKIVDAFTIRNVAITNLEYKTFLADLLIQGKSDEYFKSEVNVMNWQENGYQKLAYSYFQDEKYNDYPVVNVSEQGALLFCNWLQNELIKYLDNTKQKNKDLVISLPNDADWLLAAQDGYAKIAYETGYNTLFDISEGNVDYAFVKRMQQVKKISARKDTLYSLYAINKYGFTESNLQDFWNKGFMSMSEMPFDTINSARMKLYGKIGHMSEIVKSDSNKKLWLSGLTWKTKDDYKNFENEFSKKGSSPFVTFRIVVINKNDPEYKNPFW